MATKTPVGFCSVGEGGVACDCTGSRTRCLRSPPPGRNDSVTPMTLEPLLPTEVSVVLPRGGIGESISLDFVYIPPNRYLSTLLSTPTPSPPNIPGCCQIPSQPRRVQQSPQNLDGCSRASRPNIAQQINSGTEAVRN